MSKEENKRKLHKQDDSNQNELNTHVIHEKTTVDDLMKRGFRPLNSSEVSQFDHLLRFIPSMVTEEIERAAFQGAFDQAVKDTYRVVNAPGTHMAFSQSRDGSFRGVGLSNENNQVGHGNPKFYKNEATLEIPPLSHIVQGIFNVLSAIVGQHFMEEINSNLSEIRGGIEKVSSKIDAAVNSKLEAAIKRIDDVRLLSPTDNNDPVKSVPYISSIIDARSLAMECLSYADDNIENYFRWIKESKNSKDILLWLSAIRRFHQKALNAARIIALTYVYQFEICGSKDFEEAVKYTTALDAFIDKFRNDRKKFENDLLELFDCMLKIVLKPSKLQILGLGASILGDVAAAKYGQAPVNTTKVASQLYTEKKNKQLSQVTKAVESLVTYMQDTMPLDST